MSGKSMNTADEVPYQPVPGKRLPNGADCLAVYANEFSGVILADTRHTPARYVTWSYNVVQGARSTATGHYTGDFDSAKDDFLVRAGREHGPLGEPLTRTTQHPGSKIEEVRDDD